MLSRGNSDASAHLRHVKSTASASTRQHPLSISRPTSPETARLHAVTAASRALERSPGAGLPKSNPRPNLWRANSAVYADPEASGQMNTTQSVRFVGSAANVVDRPAITMRQAATEGSRRTVNPPTTPSLDLAENLLDIHPQADDYSRFESKVASLPSSYRKLRKPRSIFGNDKTSSSGLSQVTSSSKERKGKNHVANRYGFYVRSRSNPTLTDPGASEPSSDGQSHRAAIPSQAQHNPMVR